VARSQLISTFYGVIVPLFRLNTHTEGCFENVCHVAAYLIIHKRYPSDKLRSAFSRFLKTQNRSPRLFGSKENLELMYDYYLRKRFKELTNSV
jgi:hypothetical protein